MLFWVHSSLAELFRDEGRFEDAQAHIEHAKPYTVTGPHYLAYVMGLQAHLWYEQYRFEEARSEVLRAADCFEKLGAAKDLEWCRGLLQAIQRELDAPA